MNTIKLSDVKICDDFARTPPTDRKIKKAVRHIEKFKKIDKPIVLNDGVLVDGYSRYLAAIVKGMREVPCVELQDINYIVGKFDNSNKEYTWKNDKNIDINIGDKVFVKTNNIDKNKIVTLYVTVTDIFESDSLELYNKHKSVIGKI